MLEEVIDLSHTPQMFCGMYTQFSTSLRTGLMCRRTILELKTEPDSRRVPVKWHPTNITAFAKPKHLCRLKEKISSRTHAGRGFEFRIVMIRLA